MRGWRAFKLVRNVEQGLELVVTRGFTDCRLAWRVVDRCQRRDRALLQRSAGWRVRHDAGQQQHDRNDERQDTGIHARKSISYALRP